MKKIKLLFSAVIASAIMFVSCKEEDAPIAATNLTVFPLEGGSGSLITIKGKGMRSLTKIMFNDAVASFNPVYNTDSVLLVRVPEGAKDGINQIKLFNKSGETTIGGIDFKVLAAKPIIVDISTLSSYPGSDITVTGQNFDKPNLAVTIGGKDCKIVSSTADKIVFEFPAGTTGGKMVISHKGGKVESVPSFTLDAVLMDFDNNGPADKSWKYWSGDNDQTGNFNPVQTIPAPKAGGYGKLAVTSGSTAKGYAMIGHDPTAAKWDLSKVSNESKLKFMVNNNGFPETKVRFEFTSPDGKFSTDVIFDGAAGWRAFEIPLAKMVNSSGAKIPDVKKLGELKMFLIGYNSAKKMDANLDNICLSAN